MKEVRGYFGEKWGRIEGDTYITERSRQEHYCYKYAGWGIEYELYLQLEKKVKTVKIICHDNGKTYYLISKIETWKEKGKVDQLNPLYGKQIFLAQKHMQVVI